ncbi:type II CRISPR-associated endonuclease Cas1 [Clostridium estertheticum]|uniref:type II CRISPR-associated endonuclease Cas1 n=1 Tax=Clostridium estertheticum TaxID=238834 RepID=UPI0013EE9C5C|nr:type II CRISPR-associated endonuclease Cas1 [Clostridium estertheticum]MBZ9607276.1 type II CRISPR-associated endonuclease Cas1 [Clostridium estertheticum]
MSWRTVVISNKSKLTYKNNYLIVRSEEINMVHLSEINTLVIDTTQVSITGILMCELLQRKIKIIFCDERHNPKGEVIPYYGAHNTSKKILNQINWESKHKDNVWMKVVEQKILNQSKILKKHEKENSDKLIEYSKNVSPGDITNREGHSAKVYFNSLFGKDFTRDGIDDINAALDYGYSILLSNFNKEVVSNGYITQLGICHRNEFNSFNFSCDLMEPFRPVVDDIVFKNKEFVLDRHYKMKLINILNEKVRINEGEYFLSNAIQIYLNSIFKTLINGNIEDIIFMDME